MGLLILRRPPREGLAMDPHASDPLPDPPRGHDRLSDPSMLQSLLPILGGVGFIMFMLIRPSPVYIAIGIVWLMTMVGAGAAMAIQQRRTHHRRRERTRRAYLNDLDRARTRTREDLQRQTAFLVRANPDPVGLIDVVRRSERLWERRRDDSDALHVRIGVGDTVTEIAQGPADPAPMDADPIAVDAVERLRDDVRTIEDAPRILPLRDVGRLLLAGDLDRAQAMTRAMLCQLATWHAPSDVRLVVCAAPELAADWEWVRWLPHCRWTEESATVGAPVITTSAGADAAVAGLLAARRSPSGRAHLGAHVVVVLDGLDVDEETGSVARAAAASGSGLTVVDLSNDRPVDAAVSVTLWVDEDGLVRPGSPVGAVEEEVLATADDIGVGDCEVLARMISPWRLPGHSLTGSAAAESSDLPALLGLHDVAVATAEHGWQARPATERLAVPIGVSSEGEPIVLDLKEAAAGGMGPHGLIVGATGSGKSELLRTVVLSLAVTHPPEDLAFVLVDFKGGAAFAGLSRLPHVAGTVTNLMGDDALVLRARDALQGEMKRRQKLLSTSGSLNDIGEYQRLRANGRPDLEALPTLLIVIDEFAELMQEHSEVAELIGQMGRLGRSLGVHLLLASQRYDGSAVRGLESHLSYRIALRTFTESDSSQVLGTKDAASLPAPGTAILQHGGVMSRMQVLHVSGPLDGIDDGSDAGDRDEADSVEVMAATASGADRGRLVRDAPGDRASAVHEARMARLEQGPTLLETVVEALQLPSRRVRPVWLKPLPPSLPLSVVLPGIGLRPGQGLRSSAHYAGKGRVAIGVLDRPLEQRVEPLCLDLFGKDASVLLEGAAQSGKSTVLATTILSLALTHTPVEMQVYVIDLGGGRLVPLADLPHVGGVATRAEPERIARTVDQVIGVIDNREQVFRTHRIGSMGEFRKRCAQGDLPEERHGDVVLVVDGFADLRKFSDDYDDLLADIARRGPGMGVHLIVSATRSVDLRPALRDTLVGRLELRLNDSNDSDIDRKLAKAVPRDLPGRGLVRPGLMWHAALPVLLGVAGRRGEVKVDELVERIAAGWDGPVAHPVPVLPTSYEATELGDTGHPVRDGLVLGVEEQELQVQRVDLVRRGPHLVVLGDGEAGKSSLLRGLLVQLARVPIDEALIYVVDSRLGLLETVPHERLSGFATAPPASFELADEISEILAKREPGPDVSPRELRNRSWWSGPEIYLVVDDYDLLLGAGVVTDVNSHPLGPLLSVIARAGDLGLHLIVTSKVRGSSRVLRDGIVGGAMQQATPALLMSGDRMEGFVLEGHRPQVLPAGRGLLIHGTETPRMVQTPWTPPVEVRDEDEPDDDHDWADPPPAAGRTRRGGRHAGPTESPPDPVTPGGRWEAAGAAGAAGATRDRRSPGQGDRRQGRGQQ